MHEYAEIKAYKHTERGTELRVIIPKKELGDYIKRFSKNGIVQAELRLDDGRTISADQRKKIYATIKDISLHTGHLPEELKEIMKYYYIADSGEDYFSLSNCSVTTARLFINYLIEFAFQWDIPLADSGLDRTDDISNYLYMCIKYRKCFSTGKLADLHHCTGSKVGMGRNRHKISHSGKYFLPVSRKLHDEIHVIGDKSFFEKYHVYGIQVDDETLKELGYKVDELENHEDQEG
ncbi:putative HNHc nuclease [Alkaliphilus sp. B6464]|uniref:putative HNHc nuclease n=1 Tax=Alkaliphilus sp. B6464 TaxID=2731219 RepID=UPI001BA480AB|nr:putative HNHc nuclease [Alkaliphilus sp. B6464]QUH21437.1 hypothetical protein HYG84_17145 [Alkaliphilus sp. B6464]